MSIRRPVASVVLALAVSGCMHRTHDVANAFVWDAQMPGGGTLHLRDLNGEIRVQPATDGKVSVRASKHWRRGKENAVHFVTRQEGNDVYVCALWGTANRCDASGYGATRASFLRRFLRLFSMSSSRTDMAVNFEVAIPAGVRLDASTVNGNVNATGVSAGLHASTVNGNVRASGGAPVSVRSVNGEVTVALDALGAADSVSAKTVNGNVTVTVPADFQGSVELMTVNGAVGSDLPVTTSGSLGGRRLTGQIGSAPRSLKLESVNGTVRIDKRS